jgi:hypothetical protein
MNREDLKETIGLVVAVGGLLFFVHFLLTVFA